MIQNIEKYGNERGISRQDALQVFMQVMALKGLMKTDAVLIGGTALVMGHGNPRFSEDIDLTGVDDPRGLRSSLSKSSAEIADILEAKTKLVEPKSGKTTWRLSCEIKTGFSAQLHIDTQNLSPITHHPIMIEYPGLPPFVFSSIKLDEIMADKLVALAFRNYASGRDIFDLWFHWLKNGSATEREMAILDMVKKKLSARKLEGNDFLKNLQTKMNHGISKRVSNEWERYLPAAIKNSALYKNIFNIVSEKIETIKL